MRKGYKIVLPPSGKQDLLKISWDDDYPQKTVETFVDSLKRSQMRFYEDTTATLLESDRCVKTNISDPSGQKAPVTLWQCESCKQWTTYQGVERGHKTDWKLELKKAGVKNLGEAIIVYNNLLNLQVECSTCNSSHAFEKDEEAHFKDLPTKDDFSSSKEGKKKYQDLIDSYNDKNLDKYDSDDSMIDDTEYQPETLVLMESIHLADDGGVSAGTSESFGKTLVRVTDKTKGKWIKVQIVKTWDEKLKYAENKYFWTLGRKLKEGVVTAL